MIKPIIKILNKNETQTGLYFYSNPFRMYNGLDSNYLNASDINSYNKYGFYVWCYFTDSFSIVELESSLDGVSNWITHSPEFILIPDDIGATSYSSRIILDFNDGLGVLSNPVVPIPAYYRLKFHAVTAVPLNLFCNVISVRWNEYFKPKR